MMKQIWIYHLVSALVMVSLVQGQTPNAAPGETSPIYYGVITGQEVNIRSGPSTNYYEVAKLRSGERVTVWGVADEWCSISPPPACFSVVHKNFVDVDQMGRTGVVNADAVMVRAGSALKPDLYAKQLKLDRGAAVTVLGDHNDDYWRIKPPSEARVYVHQDYVQRVTQPTAESGAATFTGDDVSGPSSVATSMDDSTQQDGATPDGDVSPSPLQPGKFRNDIAELDALVDTEYQKPLMQRDYAPLIERFTALAEQDVDPYAAAYANARLGQLRLADSSIEAVQSARSLMEDVSQERMSALRTRDNMVPPVREIGGGFDAVGELRPSVLFSGPFGPQRYRLLDTSGPYPRTVAYVEIPADAAIDVADYLGTTVGVRARSRRLMSEAVDPVELIVASELVRLDSAASSRQVDSRIPSPGQ